MCVPAIKLSFPRHIPVQIYHHYFEYRGVHLTELSISVCTDELLEVIGNACSSKKLKRLTLSNIDNKDNFKKFYVTDRGVIAIQSFKTSLLELNLSSLQFSHTKTLLDFLSNLSILRKLFISNVSVMENDGSQMLPVPRSLPRLQRLYISEFQRCKCFHSCVHCRRVWRLESEWNKFFTYYSELKSLQICGIYYLTQYAESLEALRKALAGRSTNLEYLGVQSYDQTGRNIIKRMNANKITSFDTVEEILIELKMGDLWFGDFILPTGWIAFCLMNIWESLATKDSKTCRDMLAVINFLIPKHMDDDGIWIIYLTSVTLLYMVENLLCVELNLTPTFIQTFVSHIKKSKFYIDDSSDINTKMVRNRIQKLQNFANDMVSKYV